MRLALLVGLLLCAPALAQPGTPDGGTPAAGVLTRPPELLRQVEARFPPALADAGVGGTVMMEVDLGADGRVMDARVVQSAGPEFDAAALEAVRQFEFSPAEVDGAPAPVRILYSYEFLFRPEPAAPTPEQPPEPVVNFAGRILQRGTRDPLAGATVAVLTADGPLEATTGPDGTFELAGVPVGTWPLVITAQDHARYEETETFVEGERTFATYYVRRRQYGAFETVVRGERERKEVSRVTLRQEEIRLMPGSQGDALRVIQNLPGVARAPFSAGLLIVRGGKPWDTRVYVDNTYVPQLFHFGGLYATFNSNLLEDISFQPGNFSAQFGRNIGGVVRAKTRTPSRKGVHGYADLNLVDASALVEAPLGDRWSVAVGARRSHVEAVLPLALDLFAPEADDILSFTIAPRYYDYQVKLQRSFDDPRDRLSISFFGSNDRVALLLENPAYDPEGRSEFDTLLAYNRLAFNLERGVRPGLRSSSHLSVGADQFDFGAGADIYARTAVYPVVARQDLELELLDRTLTLNAGLDAFVIPYRSRAQVPPRFKLNQLPDPFVSRRLIEDDSWSTIFEPAVYAEAVWTPVEALKLVPGIRLDYDATLDRAWVDPRLATFVRVGEKTTLKGGIGLFHQPPDYRQGILTEKFGNPDLKPEGAVHYSVGAERQLTEAIGVDLQLYYKTLFDQALPTLAPPAGSTADVDTVDLRYQSTGRGKSYGLELLVRHQLTHNLFGWLAYSLSRTERRSPLGTGQWELSPLDQPHNLVALASYKLPYDFVLGARVRFASGALDTPYVGAIYDANGNYYFPIPGERFSRRLPAFFQLDVRLDRRWVYDTWMLALYADVMNVTNRQNVEGVSYNFDYTQQRYVTGLPIIPAIGARGEW